MTETEWLRATDRHVQFAFLAKKVSERKLRLLTCACTRTLWHHLHDADSQRAVERAERYAEGLADETELARAWRNAIDAAAQAGRQSVPLDAIDVAYVSPKFDAGFPFDADDIVATAHYFAACAAAKSGLNAAYTVALCWPNATKRPAWIDLFCCVVGPSPFRSVAIEPVWLTSTVVALAEGIYQDRAFDRLPILADALQDAGCDNEDILSHCRQPGEHVRGCWVVDLLTGRR